MTSFGNVYSVEWNCASTTNTGTFTRSTSCTISGNNHVVVLNTLEIIGSNTDMNNLIMISAATCWVKLGSYSPFNKSQMRTKT